MRLPRCARNDIRKPEIAALAMTLVGLRLPRCARNGHNTQKVLLFLFSSFKYSEYIVLLIMKILRLEMHMRKHILLSLLNTFNKHTKNQLYVANLIKNTHIISNIL